jgi:hypothetical protein
MAFTQNTQATRVKQPRRASVQIMAADASNSKVVDTAGPSGSKYVSLVAASSDTVSHLLAIQAGGSSIGLIPIPASAGFNGIVPTVNLLDPAFIPLPLDSDGNPYFFLNATETLSVAVSGASVSAGAQINVHALAIGDF